MNKKKYIIVGFIILVIVSLIYINNDNNKNQLTTEERQWLKSQSAIIYAANEKAPPLRFVDQIDNQYKGVVVDLINQLSLELGYEIQTIPMKWDEALLSLKEGKTQICDIFINAERSQFYLFTDSIYNLRTVLLTRSSESFNVNQINNMRVATEKGDYANNYLMENYPNVELVYTNNVEEGLVLFLNGKVDAVIGDEPIITYLLNKRNENQNPEYSNIVLYQEEVVLGVPKDKPELVPILNKAINSIKTKGQIEKIQQKWFGISTPLTVNNIEREIIRNIAILVVIVGSTFVFIILNNLSLQKKVKKRTKELENSRDELQIIFDEISDYMLVVDSDKKVLRINKSLADYLGVSTNEILGEDCNKYIGMFCNNCNECIIKEVNLGNNKVKKESTVGNEVYEINLQVLKEINNTLLITIKNITLDKIKGNQMLQTNKMVAIGQLAAGMAHEIRNPLGIIRTQSYLIRINDKIDDAVNKSLEFIDNAVERASKIIDNILSFSRLSSNDIQNIDINELIKKLLEMHNDIIYKNNIKVEIKTNIKKELKLNVESMEHIIINLISNSIDAMENNGILKISTDIEDGNLILICEDNGYGISDKDINNIYNPFFTTKELGKGTGLGLFIVYSEVEKLNGKIDVQSILGEKAKFTIKIPLERRDD
ncbi:transporter substrate-binding domain-containing protein [Sedimentibacter sp. MB31-C6]|uniref:transporter substrate-binding domain-containing protein n=1 Tax=Sedimentibacter sp. MB31-C6 TaxID=3109366 RepID=UPI002DDD2351|nr:transporter substrate-binding domain-containing protein [Sedimentibacter sp. MB36-C1]WSI03590.1 transporter substrate-binding domain-containing protein [Sedimentibacter sp. MB36-C1]